MSEQLINILSSSAISGGLVAVVLFLSKEWIKNRLTMSIRHEYETKMEQLKSELNHKSEKELAALRTELQIAANDKNFRFSKVFEKTETVIVGVYNKLFFVKWYASECNRPPTGTDKQVLEALDTWRTAFQAFVDYYTPNKLYIPKATTKKIEDFVAKVSTLVFTTLSVDKAVESKLSTQDLDAQIKNIERLNNEIPKLLTSLEDEFQKILGFPIDESSPAA